MAYTWDKFARTRAKNRYRKNNYLSHEAMKIKTSINQQINASKQQMFELAEKVADIIEKDESNKFLKKLENKKKKIISENKKKSQKLAQDIRGITKYSEHPLQKAIDAAKKTAKAMYESRGTTTDQNIVAKANALYAGAEITEKALNFVTTSAQFAYNRYTTLQEDYMTVQGIANAKDTMNRVNAAGKSIINGASTGAKTGGVVGAIIGGVAGAIDFGVNQYFEYQQRMSSYYQQLNATNFQTSFDASRLGLIGSSGTEN